MATVRLAGKTAITLLLVILSVWLLRYGHFKKLVDNKAYSNLEKPLEKLGAFPEAFYDHGMMERLSFRPEKAVVHFRQAVAKNLFYGDAWLALAETHVSLGNSDKAEKILYFLDSMAWRTVRWKWKLLLLAKDLKNEPLFIEYLHFLLKRENTKRDLLQLMDAHVRRDVETAVSLLEPEFYVDYLRWLMGWSRLADARVVWGRMVKRGLTDTNLVISYMNFLFEQGDIRGASQLRNKISGEDSITNPGFENEIGDHCFSWRMRGRKGLWRFLRDGNDAARGRFAMRVTFEGKKNIDFGHLYQVIPLESDTRYRLTYQWRSRDITTDQGPFIEVAGYKSRGLHAGSPMITGTHAWETEAIEFAVPENCDAVVIRLRRSRSGRFDCKIQGDLWLDNFQLEQMSNIE